MKTSPLGAGIVQAAGCPIAYDLCGSGPPVLFIQGVGVHGEGWRPQVDALAGRFSCLTFDNRGMGRSVPVGAAVRVERMAQDAQAVMDAVGWRSAHVVGHSLGGLVALHLALSAPERVRSLSLLCSFADGRVATQLTPSILWLALRSRLGPRRWRRRAFLELILPPSTLSAKEKDTLADGFARLFGHDLADQPPAAMAQFHAMRRYDATPRLDELADLPTLVVSAAHDRIAPPSAGRAVAAGVHGAKYVQLAEAAHGVPIHHPERVNALLVEHLNDAERR